MALLKKYRVALVVLLLLGTCSAAYGFHSRFFYFFFRRPAAAVPEGTTFVIDAERGLLYQVMFDGTNPATRTRTDLEGVAAAKVNDSGQLEFLDDIVLTDDPDAPTKTVTVTLDPADLRGGFFGSFFSTRGTAICDDGVNPTTTIDVFASGIISYRGGEYSLRSALRGFESTTDTSTPPVTTLTLLRVNLNGAGWRRSAFPRRRSRSVAHGERFTASRAIHNDGPAEVCASTNGSLHDSVPAPCTDERAASRF